MRSNAVLVFALTLVTSAALAQEDATASPEAPAAVKDAPTDAVYFLNDVMPLVNKLGCNLSSCHGSVTGKGGFKLSMFGAEPEDDYAALTRAAAGRRVNRVEPLKSLFLLKVTASIAHTGGQKVQPGSPEYNMLATWVARGTAWSDKNQPELTSLKIAPESLVLKKGESRQLSAAAVFSDGTQKDVTGYTSFAVAGEGVATVDPGGKVQAEAHGESYVIASYMRTSGLTRVVVPQSLPSPFPELAANNKIDELVYAKLKELGIPPSELCSDEEFLRRVYLDVIGTLPTADEARAFLADTDPQKRGKLIDKLLESEEFADFWALKWGDLFRIKSEFPSNLWPNAVQAYHHWVHDSIARDKPYDQFATELLTSSGSNFRVPPVNYYRAFLKRTPQNLAEVTALIFMGARVGCARCHAHPTEDWTLDDSVGLAAFFAPVRYKATTEWKEEIVYINPKQTMRHPKTGELVKPTFLGEEAVEVAVGEDPRAKLAEWLTAPENPWFGRNIVNRTWFWLLGRGIVHDPDDLRPTNPPTNPELLEYLAKELVSHDYHLKHVYRLILNSRTYQLSSKTNEWNREDRAHFSHYYTKRLGAETLLDAIGQVTERWDTYRSIIPEPFVIMPTGFRATHLADGSIDLPFLQLFGRPPRDTAYESDRDLELSMRQTLHLLNSSDVQNKINASPRLRRLFQEVKEDSKIVEELYLTTVSRPPKEQESSAVLAYVSGNNPEALAQAEAEKKTAEDALAKVKEELAKATADYDAAEKAATEAAEEAAAEKRKLADEAKAKRDKLAGDEKAAGTRLAEANQKVNAAKAPPSAAQRQQALQDLLWALFNTKEFLFNH